jgi:hypothetical protein
VRGLLKCRPGRNMLLAGMIALTAVLIGASNTHAEQNTQTPTDDSVSMALTEHYANQNYDYACHPTLESQTHLRLTSFGGSADIPGQQTELPPDHLTITLQDPPSTWYCTKKSPTQK